MHCKVSTLLPIEARAERGMWLGDISPVLFQTFVHQQMGPRTFSLPTTKNSPISVFGSLSSPKHVEK